MWQVTVMLSNRDGSGKVPVDVLVQVLDTAPYDAARKTYALCSGGYSPCRCQDVCALYEAVCALYEAICAYEAVCALDMRSVAADTRLEGVPAGSRPNSTLQKCKY